MSRRRSRVIEKRRRRAKDDLRALHQRRQSFDRILGLVGLGDLRSKLSDKTPSLLARAFPRPGVVPDHSRESDNLKTKGEELRREFEKVSIRIGHDILSHADYFTVCIGLHYFCQGWKHFSSTQDERRDWEHVLSRLTTFVERYHREMMTELYAAIRQFLAINSRLDGPIYTARHGTTIEGRKQLCTTTLCRAMPECVLIETGGYRRRAFRCGSTKDYDTGEITWISWDAEVLGPGTIGRVPVYIQSHAIGQARERLWLAKNDNSFHYFLAEALRQPRVTPGREGQLLVDVKLGREKVGYLVAELVGDKVLVKTFLLITMQGTPEGEKLHRRLRMSRADLEYLELDNFAKLALTDLLRDDDIAEIFRECGCEGLLALARRDYPFEIRGGFANKFKSYFGQALTSPFDDACRVSHPASGQSGPAEGFSR